MRRLAWVVALACTLGCGAPISSQIVVTTDNWREFVTPGDVPEPFLAVTRCHNGRPVVHFSPTLPDSLREEMWQHERVHVAFLLNRKPWETCEQVHNRTIADPAELIFEEAQAYCAQVTWTMNNRPRKRDPLSSLLYLADRLAWVYSQMDDQKWHIPKYDIAALFVRICPAVVDT